MIIKGVIQNRVYYAIPFCGERFSTLEMIKYIIDKGINLEYRTCHGWLPIHLICYYSNLDTFNYIVNKGVNCNACINEFDDIYVNYNLIDLINKRFTDESKKQQYLNVLQNKINIYL